MLAGADPPGDNMTDDERPFAVDPLTVMGDAKSNVARYFGLAEDAAVPYDGASFESYGENHPNRITADDLIAVTMLSIELGRISKSLRPQHALAIEAQAAEVSRLLEQLPHDRDLPDLDVGEARRLLSWEGPQPSPARELYELLRRGLGVPTNPGRVTVYKLLARKRPRLLPIRDSLVELALAHQRPDPWWMPWWYAFDRDRGEGCKLRSTLEAARAALPDPSRLSLLRAADVAIWMENAGHRATSSNNDPMHANQ
jgi:hypothetical protein